MGHPVDISHTNRTKNAFSKQTSHSFVRFNILHVCNAILSWYILSLLLVLRLNHRSFLVLFRQGPKISIWELMDQSFDLTDDPLLATAASKH